MGIRDKPTAPRSPWQNPYVERLIGTIRRACPYLGRRTCAGSWASMPRIIMNRAFIARWTKMPHSTGPRRGAAMHIAAAAAAGVAAGLCICQPEIFRAEFDLLAEILDVWLARSHRSWPTRRDIILA